MRLLTLSQIRQEKFPRSKSYIFAMIAEGKFPRPIETEATGGPRLWNEDDVDRFLENLVAASKQRADTPLIKRTAKATADRMARRQVALEGEAVSA